MTVEDLLDLFVEGQEVEIYDLDAQKTTYIGDLDDMPLSIQYSEIRSIDCLTKGKDILVINVSEND